MPPRNNNSAYSPRRQMEDMTCHPPVSQLEPSRQATVTIPPVSPVVEARRKVADRLVHSRERKAEAYRKNNNVPYFGKQCRSASSIIETAHQKTAPNKDNCPYNFFENMEVRRMCVRFRQITPPEILPFYMLLCWKRCILQARMERRLK
jgi:hypothetical protein